MGGPARFHAIREAIPDMSDRMLSERLRELGGRRGRDTVRHSGNTRARGICADRKGARSRPRLWRSLDGPRSGFPPPPPKPGRRSPEHRRQAVADVEMLAATIGERNVWRFEGGEARRDGHQESCHGCRLRTWGPVLRRSQTPRREHRSRAPGHVGSCRDRSRRRALRLRDGVSRRQRQRDRDRRNAGARAPIRARPAREDDSIRRVRQRGASVLSDPQMGSVVYANAARRAARRSSRCCRSRRWGISPMSGESAVSAAAEPDLSGYRELHRVRIESLIRAPAASRNAPSRPERHFRSNPLRRLSRSRVSDGRISGHSGKPAIRRSWSPTRRRIAIPGTHTAHDTPDKIDFDKLGQVVDGLEHVVHVLARGV